MKKMFMFVVASAAMTLASCGGKTAANANPDSLAVEGVAEEVLVEPAEAESAAKEVVAQLQEQLKNADPEQIRTIVNQVGEVVSSFVANGENEAVQTYTAVVSNFVAEHAEELQKIGAASSLAEVIAAVPGIPAQVVETAQSAVTGVKTDALSSAISAIASGDSVSAAVRKAAVGAASNVASDAAAKLSEGAAKVEEGKAAVEKAKAAVEAAPETAKKAAADAANKAIDDAASKAAEEAKKKLGL